MLVKISIDMVYHYLMQMMGAWFCDHDEDADSLEEYEECVLEMGTHIKKWNDEKYAQLAFAKLIESEEISTEIWESLEWAIDYPLSKEEILELIKYTYLVLWPNTPPEEALNGYETEFIKTGIHASSWRSIRDQLNPSFNQTS